MFPYIQPSKHRSVELLLPSWLHDRVLRADVRRILQFTAGTVSPGLQGAAVLKRGGLKVGDNTVVIISGYLTTLS